MIGTVRQAAEYAGLAERAAYSRRNAVQLIQVAGNQTARARSDLVIGGFPLPWIRPSPPPLTLKAVVAANANHMVFPLLS